MVVNNSPSSRFISAKHIYYEIEFLLCPSKTLFSIQVCDAEMILLNLLIYVKKCIVSKVM